MLKIELPSQYQIGNKKLDDQHSQLIFSLMKVVTLTKNEDHKNEKQQEFEIHSLLKDLRSYTMTHFLYEEHFMEKIKYPELEAHKILHKIFSDKLIEIQKSALRLKKEKNQVLLKEMALFLKEWFLKHILDEDKKIVSFQLEAEANAVIKNKFKAQTPT